MTISINRTIIFGLVSTILSIIVICTFSALANGEYIKGFTGVKTGIGYSTFASTVFILTLCFTCRPCAAKKNLRTNYIVLLVLFTLVLLLPFIFECIMVIEFFPKMLGPKQNGKGAHLAIYRCAICAHMFSMVFLVSACWHAVFFRAEEEDKKDETDKIDVVIAPAERKAYNAPALPLMEC